MDTWPEISLANDLIKRYCDSKENLFYISTRDFFIGENGLPTEEFFIKDKLFDAIKDLIK